MEPEVIKFQSCPLDMLTKKSAKLLRLLQICWYLNEVV